jgi:thioredoxin-like negative regulator of GroEL
MASDALIAAHLAALDADPASADAAERVEALARAGATTPAAQRARAAVDAGAVRGEVYTALARGMWQAGGGERALGVLAFLDPAERRRRDTARLKIEILRALGREAEARWEAERRLLDAPGDELVAEWLASMVPPPEPHDQACALVTLARAERLVQAGAWSRAERVLRQLRVARPWDREAMLALQRLQVRRRADDARREAERHDGDRGGRS